MERNAVDVAMLQFRDCGSTKSACTRSRIGLGKVSSISAAIPAPSLALAYVLLSLATMDCVNGLLILGWTCVGTGSECVCDVNGLKA